MHKVILLRVGGRKFHLIKIASALVVVGSALGLLGSVAKMFRLMKQLELAAVNRDIALQVFGMLPEFFTQDVMLGYFMEPSAWFMLWLALFTIGAMAYRSGNMVLPIEGEIGDEKG